MENNLRVILFRIMIFTFFVYFFSRGAVLGNLFCQGFVISNHKERYICIEHSKLRFHSFLSINARVLLVNRRNDPGTSKTIDLHRINCYHFYQITN